MHVAAVYSSQRCSQGGKIKAMAHPLRVRMIWKGSHARMGNP
jgi:hypothetical protein